MKKNIFQIVIVFITVLVLSTTVMARGKKHYRRWWNPFSSLWSAIHELQEGMEDVKLGQQNAPVPQGFSTASVSEGEAGPMVCPGCLFPAGLLPEDLRDRMKGAYLPGVGFC